jgi:dihydroorotase
MLRAGVVDGTVDAVCSDHAPVDDDAKQLPFGESEPGATGLELLLPLVLKWATETQVALPVALARVTSQPAAVLGIDAGSLRVGAPADVCVFDPDAPWRVTPQALRSQGKNTPFAGYELTGRVVCTLVAGEIAYESERMQKRR